MSCPQVAGGLQPCSSGGTTGDTLYFWVDRRRQAQDLGARLFMQSLFGIRPGERRVHLWGSPLEARTARLRRWRDWLLNERLLDAFDLSPVRMDAHLLSILRFRPSVIYGYTSAAALLARHAAARYGPQDFPWLRLVVLTGEEVTPDQVAQVRQTFGCPVAAEYGNREVGLIAHQCPQGRMHILWPHVHVDIVAVGQVDRGSGREGDRPPDEEGACPPGGPPAVLEPGQFGEVICTTLNTRAQPFLRYRVGDAGRLLPGLCPCGLPLPVMRVEGGKIAGLLALPDGRLCHGAVSSHALHHLPGIVTFRTHQRRMD
jgi:phenylacetate-CoA ligase